MEMLSIRSGSKGSKESKGSKGSKGAKWINSERGQSTDPIMLTSPSEGVELGNGRWHRLEEYRSNTDQSHSEVSDGRDIPEASEPAKTNEIQMTSRFEIECSKPC